MSVLGWAPETRVPAQDTYEEVLPRETGMEWIKQEWRARSQTSQLTWTLWGALEFNYTLESIWL